MQLPKLPMGMLARVLVLAALLGAAGLVVVLAAQNREFREQVRHLRRERRILHEGVVVPAFRTTTLAGDSVLIGDPPEGGRQLLMILNAACPYCRETLPYWKNVVRRIRADTVAIQAYAVSLDPDSVTRAYLTEHAFDVPAIRFPDERTAAVYRAIGVPITVVIGAGGQVLYGRGGAITRTETVDSLLAVLGAVRP